MKTGRKNNGTGRGQKVHCWNVGLEAPTHALPDHSYVVLPMLTASPIRALLYDIATAFMIAMYAPLIVCFDCLVFS